MKLRVLPYKGYSESAKAIVRALSPNAIMKKQSTPVKGRRKVLLNWGHSSPAFSLTGVTVLNKPNAVSNASNKLTALRMMKEAGVNVPEFSHNRTDAERWIAEGRIVLCRTLLRANSGRGIVVAKTVAELVAAPLYVKYIRKEKEYRLHVFNGQVIDMVEKRRRRGFTESTDYNRYIRSYEQGWVFVRDGIQVTEETKTECVKAVSVLGLDFGAVDVVMNRENNPVILEVNTSPGVQGTTLERYKGAIQLWFRNLR